MRRRLTTPLWLLFSAALLTACAARSEPPRVVTKIETVKQRVPPQLLRCPPAPIPAADLATQRQVARFVLDLHVAGDECRAKLEAVRQLIEEPAVFDEVR